MYQDLTCLFKSWNLFGHLCNIDNLVMLFHSMFNVVKVWLSMALFKVCIFHCIWCVFSCVCVCVCVCVCFHLFYFLYTVCGNCYCLFCVFRKNCQINIYNFFLNYEIWIQLLKYIKIKYIKTVNNKWFYIVLLTNSTTFLLVTHIFASSPNLTCGPFY